MSLGIRAGRDSDRELLRGIFNRIIETGQAFVYETPFTVDAFQCYLAGYSAVWVAESEGRVVGGYVLRPNQPGRGSHVGNGTYSVDPNVRGQGIGRQLGLHSLETARQMGFRALQFNAVVARNESAAALWRNLGFAVIGTIPAAFRLPDGSQSDLLVMHGML